MFHKQVSRSRCVWHASKKSCLFARAYIKNNNGCFQSSLLPSLIFVKGKSDNSVTRCATNELGRALLICILSRKRNCQTVYALACWLIAIWRKTAQLLCAIYQTGVAKKALLALTSKHSHSARPRKYEMNCTP
jgi:hypothetical protein